MGFGSFFSSGKGKSGGQRYRSGWQWWPHLGRFSSMMWGKSAFFMLLERCFGGFLKNAYLYVVMIVVKIVA
jgi:hypothetical protein